MLPSALNKRVLKTSIEIIGVAAKTSDIIIVLDGGLDHSARPVINVFVLAPRRPVLKTPSTRRAARRR